MYVRGLPAATAKELILDQRARYEGEFIIRIRPWLYSFLSRCAKGCKWPGRAGRGGPRKDGTVIGVGLALAYGTRT